MNKIIMVAIVFLIVVSFPAALAFGLFVIPVALVQMLLRMVWNKVLVKLGVAKLMTWVFTLIAPVLSWLTPDFIERPWVRYKDRFAKWLDDSGYKLAGKFEERRKAKAAKQAQNTNQLMIIPQRNDMPPTS